MREILFRAKLAETGELCKGEWVYGLPKHGFDSIAINYLEVCGEGCYEIDGKTLEQFTGLYDKNGTKIFEGDFLDHFAAYGRVIFEDGMFTLDLFAKTSFGYRQPLCYIDTTKCVVLGNIHD